MRIRKNAKLSPLVYPASSSNAGAVVQTHVCQLNLSPWDVMSFSPPSSPPPPPPPPPQVNKNDVSAGNGGSSDNVPVVERKFNPDWTCESMDGDTTNKTAEMVEQPHVVEEEPVVFCCKTDGKNWPFRRKTTKGNSLCEHHLSPAKNYNNLNLSKKSEKSVVEAQRRTRPKKASASSSSNPYEFYYYSGFGPSWGKKRGKSSSSKNTSSDMSHNIEHEQELNPSLLSQFDEDTDSLDDDEEEYENGENGKKRGRKPIKAKSLKSLM